MEDTIRLEALHSIVSLSEDIEATPNVSHPLASMLSTVNKDTVYFDQAVCEPDAPEFVNAIINKVNVHVDHKHWKLKIDLQE